MVAVTKPGYVREFFARCRPPENPAQAPPAPQPAAPAEPTEAAEPVGIPSVATRGSSTLAGDPSLKFGSGTSDGTSGLASHQREGTEGSSVRCTQPFTPVDERELRWHDEECGVSPDSATPRAARPIMDDVHGTQLGEAVPQRAADGATLGGETTVGTPPSDSATEDKPAPDTDDVVAAGTGPAHTPEEHAVTARAAAAPDLEQGVQPTDGPKQGGTLLAEPQRIPPNPPIYDAWSMYCYQCERPRPPRAHHCRRCGTCVLKMDHHCPWIGRCVGAHNYQYYWNTVFWGALLSLFTLVSTVVLFALGAVSHGASRHWSEHIHNWNVDGFMISVVVISTFFLLFTGVLTGMHLYLAGHNLTSVEQRAINTLRSREGMLLRTYYSKMGEGAAVARGCLGPLRSYRARHAKLHAWNERWGAPHKHGNPWWIGNGQELEQAVRDGGVVIPDIRYDAVLAADGPKLPGDPERRPAPSASALLENTSLHGKPTFPRSAFLLNMELSLGRPWSWIFPLAPPPNEHGLWFPMNPRYSRSGAWQPREYWPPLA